MRRGPCWQTLRSVTDYAVIQKKVSCSNDLNKLRLHHLWLVWSFMSWSSSELCSSPNYSITVYKNLLKVLKLFNKFWSVFTFPKLRKHLNRTSFQFFFFLAGCHPVWKTSCWMLLLLSFALFFHNFIFYFLTPAYVAALSTCSAFNNKNKYIFVVSAQKEELISLNKSPKQSIYYGLSFTRHVCMNMSWICIGFLYSDALLGASSLTWTSITH